MQYLKADTVTEVTVGPAIAVGDGFTPVTGLVGTSADEFELIKHGATVTTTIAGTLAAITGADGYYALDLSATDTDTEGRLTLLINDDSLILPIRLEFMVVNANVFDSLFAAAGTDKLQVDIVEQVGTTVPTPAVTGVPDVNMTHHVDALASVTNSELDVNVGQIIGTIPSLTGGDIDVNIAAAAANTINASALATDAVNEIRDAITGGAFSLDTDANGRIRIVDGTAAGELDTLTGTVALRAATQTSIDAIETDTNSLNDTKIPDTISLANINTEVLDVMNVDTITLPGQEAPPLVPTHREMDAWLYKNFRNRKDQTSTLWQLYADNETTVDAKATVSDDTTTAIKQEIVTGP